MEPIITIEGYQALQSQQTSRDLLNSYYRTQGYEVITPKNAHPNEQSIKEATPKAQQQSNSASTK